MLDLAIVGGTLVIPEQGLVQADVGVVGEQVAAIARPGELPQARQTLEAAGCHVLPGVVDPHVHFGNLTSFERDVEYETRAALAGGVTTVGCFLREPVSYHDVFEPLRAAAEVRSSVDFFFHLVTSTQQHLDELPSYAEHWGVTSFKAYLAGMQGIFEPVDDDYLRRLFRAAAALGPRVLVCLHAENDQIVNRETERVQAEGGEGLEAWSRARPDYSEQEAIERAAALARQAGARLYIVHLNSALGAAKVRALKPEQPELYAESVTHYLSLSTEHPLGTLLKRLPPLRSPADVDALWAAVADGTIDTLGTDNVVGSRAINRPEAGLFQARGGFTTLGTHLPVLLQEGYHRRGLDLRRLVETMTAAPARLFGLYPRKGTIRVGSDADLAIVDLERERRVDHRDLHTWSDYSPWEGQVLRGWPVATVLRGRVAVRDNRIAVEPGVGRYLARELR